MKKIWNSIRKDLWIVLLDIIAVNASYLLALLIRFFVAGQFRPIAMNRYLPAWSHFTIFYTILSIIVFIIFKLYGGMWRYAGINDMNRIIIGSLCASTIHIVGTCLFVTRMPITYYVIGALLQFVFLVMIRFSYRVLLVEKKKVVNRNIPNVPTMIIGAGETARKVIHHLEDTPFRATVVVDEKSAGKMMDGVRITSDFVESLSSVLAVFIADPNLNTDKRKEIKDKCDEAGIELQDYTGFLANLGGKIPVTSLLELANGKITLVVNGKETEYSSGNEAIKTLKERYDIKSISEVKMELVKPSLTAYVGYEAWAAQHKELTGEDVSFF